MLTIFAGTANQFYDTFLLLFLKFVVIIDIILHFLNEYEACDNRLLYTIFCHTWCFFARKGNFQILLRILF